MEEQRQSIHIPDQADAFNSIREEYSDMLKGQLSKGNNGLTKTKYITFGVEADSLKEAKADNVMVALYVLPLLVLAVFQIGAHTRYGEIFPAAIKGRYAVIITGEKPPIFIKSGLHGKLVMLKS